jgi:hypothetical protein
MIGHWVAIRKKRGFIRQVLITPDNPDRFVEDVKDAMARMGRDSERSDGD